MTPGRPPAASPELRDPEAVEDGARDPAEAACVLGRAGYTVLLTESGSGYSTFGDHALTTWSGDRLEDREGFFFFVRDPLLGVFGSIGSQPVRQRPDRYQALVRPERFEIFRREGTLESRLEVCVPVELPLEIRRVTLTNHSRDPRRLEVTSFAQVVLLPLEAHAPHPAFSRLFIQTEFVPERGVLLARRRPREADARHPWLAHALVEDGALEHETDRVRFIGRGRSLAAPRALTEAGALSGTVGNVLDPIVSLRRTVEVPPGRRARLTFLLAAGSDREAALAAIERARDPGFCDEALRCGETGEGRILAAHDAGRERQAVTVSQSPGEGGGAREASNGRWGSESDHLRSSSSGRERTDSHPASEFRHFNGTGGFSPDGREYVILLEHRPGVGLRLPPRPWINVLANEHFGCLVSETGAGPTWCGNSREHRLSPWSNDALLDPHGEALYLRDEQSGEIWSPLPGPIPAPADYEVRHGFGATRWRHVSHGIEQEACAFVARQDPVKLVRLRLHAGATPRAVSLYAYQRLVLGGLPESDGSSIVTRFDGAIGFARREATDGAGRVAFATTVAPEGSKRHFTGDRAAFVGPHGGPECPAALSAAALDGRSGPGLDPCFAQQVTVSVPAGETVELCVLFGEGRDEDEAKALVARYGTPQRVARAEEEVQAAWRELLERVQIETPSSEMDLMVNGWLAYQTLSCRLWARTAFYQSGGAFGFRDQLQDALGMLWHEPEIARAQILLHAAHQFIEGDVLHWWHPPGGRGLRTRFVDDLLWLPFLTASYVESTGDESILSETIPFLTARELEPGEDEAYLLSEPATEAADLYEHCCRAIDRSLGVGAHNLPLFGSGDWNDGMNRVGREGRGESVWMGFFLHALLGDFDALCALRSDAARRERYQSHRELLGQALDAGGWDGGWYRRGYYDDGAPLGSSGSDECRIDALAQAWSVLSGAAPEDRARQAMDAVERHLVSDEDALIRLLAPPFENTPHDPGYIKGYARGVRENGGQYTHAALWVVQAAVRLGRRDRALQLLELLNPIRHGDTPERVRVYEIEPYVVAADVYGEPPHVGRGGWSWYTGSSGWMLRAALESILGLKLLHGETLLVRPCIPASWPGFTATIRIPGDLATYEVRVSNRGGPKGTGSVAAALLDGAAVPVEEGAARVPLRRDGGVHQVEIVLG